MPEDEKTHNAKKKTDTKSPNKYQSTRNIHTGFILGCSYQFVAIILVALAVGVFLYYMSNKNYRGIIWSLFAVYVVAGLLVALYAHQHYLSSQTPAATQETQSSQNSFEPFSSAYQKYRSELGDVKGKERSADIIHQYSHQNAWAIFFNRPESGWFVLFTESLRWEFKSDTKMKAGDEYKKHHSINWLRNQTWMADGTRPPKGTMYPNGGIAKLWLINPAFWRQIGWKEWDCPHIRTRDIYTQEFEHGYIMGAFRRNLEHADALIFVLIKDNATGGHWYEYVEDVSIMRAPDCAPAPE
jgi:hypothetical protein